jgi:hypothetical protein
MATKGTRHHMRQFAQTCGQPTKSNPELLNMIAGNLDLQREVRQ